MEKLDELYLAMAEYYAKDPKRVQHFVKVHSFARLIGRAEGLKDKELFTLEAAALVHDIGIKAADIITRIKMWMERITEYFWRRMLW